MAEPAGPGRRLPDPVELAGGVADPELAAATLADLGVLRGVRVDPAGAVEVVLAPTSAAGPLLAELTRRVVATLTAAGWAAVRVVADPARPWSSDDITERGRRRLADAGLALPPPRAAVSGPVELTLAVACPHCGSTETQEITPEASAACCSLYVCMGCSEPFEFLRPV